MIDKLPPSLPYMSSQVLQATQENPDAGRLGSALAALPIIKKAFDTAKELGFQHDASELSLIEHATGALDNYCESLRARKPPAVHQKTARIFALFLDAQVSQLVRDAKGRTI